MKRRLLMPVLLLALTLGACAAGEEEKDREAALRARYAAPFACEAEVKVELPRAEETLRYTLRVACGEGRARVTVLAPEELTGVAAELEDGTQTLRYDGMVLDAGSAAPGVTAVNCVPLLLRAAAEGYVTERSTERFGDTEALRLTFETETGGETAAYTIFFSAEDTPLYAEIAQKEKIIAFVEFTNFTFGDILHP